jgi:hypothetical protein
MPARRIMPLAVVIFNSNGNLSAEVPLTEVD